MAKKRELESIHKEFDDFYQEYYGQRWFSIKSLLLSHKNKWPLKTALEILNNTSTLKSLAEQIPRPTQEDYSLDPASLLPALMLNPQPGENILDLCAAPGGKSLALLHLTGGQLSLVMNERSPQRVQRLKAVMGQFAERHHTSELKFTKHDGTRWGLYEENVYDKVLVDAPCSGERHLLESLPDLAAWSPKRHKRLAVQQVALLCAALAAIKPEGSIVYSTCSLCPLENDAVIERFLEKRSGKVEVEAISWGDVEPTRFGLQVTPDRQYGFGPIYVAKLKKANVT